jgi:methionyl-tRNA formyltransferase
MSARLVFLGTPESAVPTLEAIAARYDVISVVTQPDRPRGRSGKPVAPPVKVAATRLGIPVAQPASRLELGSTITEAGPADLGVVVAYGRILPRSVLDLVGRGYLNVHFSLLPRWRGAAPVARALLAGDVMTGVTIIRLDEGLDTGPVLTAQAADVLPTETAGELTVRLASMGARLLAGVIDPYLEGDLSPVAQSDDGLTYAEKLESDDRPLRLAAGTSDVVNRVRALSPAPSATLEIDGVVHKILRAIPAGSGPPAGQWAAVDGRPVVATSDGWVELVTIQPPGKEPRSGIDWVRGRRTERGVVA